MDVCGCVHMWVGGCVLVRISVGGWVCMHVWVSVCDVCVHTHVWVYVHDMSGR